MARPAVTRQPCRTHLEVRHPCGAGRRIASVGQRVPQGRHGCCCTGLERVGCTVCLCQSWLDSVVEKRKTSCADADDRWLHRARARVPGDCGRVGSRPAARTCTTRSGTEGCCMLPTGPLRASNWQGSDLPTLAVQLRCAARAADVLLPCLMLHSVYRRRCEPAKDADHTCTPPCTP